MNRGAFHAIFSRSAVKKKPASLGGWFEHSLETFNSDYFSATKHYVLYHYYYGIVLYRELCRAPRSSFPIPSHVLKVMAYVPQSLKGNRAIPSVNSPLTVSSDLIFSSTLAGKGGMTVSSSLSVVFQREKEIKPTFFFFTCFCLFSTLSHRLLQLPSCQYLQKYSIFIIV